jgi:hypothetical protein
MSDERLIKRRDLLKGAALLGVTAAGAGRLLAGCGGDELSCSDVSQLTDAQRQTRTRQAYVEQTPDATKRCDNCTFFTAAQNACGSCSVVPGPINPAGYCTSWAARPAS